MMTIKDLETIFNDEEHEYLLFGTSPFFNTMHRPELKFGDLSPLSFLVLNLLQTSN